MTILEQGKIAFHSGIPRDDNPHPMFQAAGQAWDDGWELARANAAMVARQANEGTDIANGEAWFLVAQSPRIFIGASAADIIALRNLAALETQP